MAAASRLQEYLRKIVPWWLSDRPGALVTGWKTLWTLGASGDAMLDVCSQAGNAALPGEGTPTALDKIGRNRAMIRGQLETDQEYAARLPKAYDRARDFGSQQSIARALHEFLAGRPMVRVVNRASRWVTCDANGVLTVQQGGVGGVQMWDWDSVSHPERTSNWHDQWVIVYPPPGWPIGQGQWPVNGNFGAPGEVFGVQTGLGHDSTSEEYDAVIGLLAQHRSFHTFIRCVIWATSTTTLNPLDAGSGLPNGTWGSWSLPGSGSRVAGGRSTAFRYWEPL